MTEITMPRLSDSMEEGTILDWLKATGDEVRAGDELVEIETDKATMTYESPDAGTLTIVAEPGATLAVGAVIATVGAASETPTPAPAPVAEAPIAAGNGAASGPRPTPLARRLARAHGIDLTSLTGTGPRGRITRSDVATAAGVDSPVRHDLPGGGGVAGEATSQQLTRLQHTVARRMVQSKSTVPDFQVQTEAGMDAVLALRAELKRTAIEPLPSINDFVLKASALALRQWPRANASFAGDHFELHERVNVGVAVAVAVADALVVPTIFDADARSLTDIAGESRRLAARVRDGRITPPELSGATFTVSNLGMYGMTAIAPVINPPQAAILGVGASRGVPALVDGQLVERRLMTLTLSCDHRILYGADAAQFLSAIRTLIEEPLRMLL